MNGNYREESEGREGHENEEYDEHQQEDQGPVDHYDPNSHEIIVKSLNYKATEEDIEQFFSQYGGVNSVKIERHHDGNSRGSCFVKFTSDDAMEKALADNGVEFMGRQIWIKKTMSKEERLQQYGRPRRRGYNNRGGQWRGRGGGYNNNYGGGYGRGGYNNYGGGYGGGGGYNNYGGGYNNYGGGYNRGGYGRGYNRGYNRGRGRNHVRPSQSNICFVGNLNYRSERDEIAEYFEQVGKVVDVRIARNPSGSVRLFLFNCLEKRLCSCRI